jgi:hypothetical protein
LHLPVDDAEHQLRPSDAWGQCAGARQRVVQVIEKLRGLRLTTAAQLVEGAVKETLAYYMPEVISALLVCGGTLGMY